MLYTDLTMKAMKIAYQLHHGQVDKAGVPYIFHPIHLAEQMHDEYTICTALLHDTVEDTELSHEQLADLFPKEIADAVKLLTHDGSCDYITYIRKIRANSIARAVKLADLRHNSDLTRVPFPTEKHLAKVEQQYALAIQILTEEGND